jgi:DNA (cytosine-5)-methyltransferase 1
MTVPVTLLPGEIIVDSFAGGGGASLGIEWALGRGPDEAINHDAEAIAMHAANHPRTRHHCESVWQVDPVTVCAGRPVGLMWLSPDCKHFSKAKGGKPTSKKIRALAHVAVRWAAAVRPRIIILENVEEFRTWGPISRETGRPCPRRRGKHYRAFGRQLERLGYVVDDRELRACDFGAPTSRKRLFLVARCDGRPIVWPTPTHGKGREHAWRTAAECIDFSIACPSIFLTREEASAIGVRRPLALATLRRVARGVKRFIIDSARPFIVQYHSAKRDGDDRVSSVDAPLPTQTTENRFAVVAPVFVSRYGERAGQDPRALPVDRPMPTIVPTQNGAQLVSAFLAKHYGDRGQLPGSSLFNPVSTITASDHHALVASTLVHFTRNADGRSIEEPLRTITAQAEKFAQVQAFLVAYYGNERDGGSLLEPMRTVTGRDRFGLVMVHGEPYLIVDIGMRMLAPRELFRAQGFPDSYVIDPWWRRRSTRTGRFGKPRQLSQGAQVRMCGNSVPPQLAEVMVRANVGAIGEPSWPVRSAGVMQEEMFAEVAV